MRVTDMWKPALAALVASAALARAAQPAPDPVEDDEALAEAPAEAAPGVAAEDAAEAAPQAGAGSAEDERNEIGQRVDPQAAETTRVINGVEGPTTPINAAAEFLGYVDIEKHFNEARGDDRVLTAQIVRLHSPNARTSVADLQGQPAHVYVLNGAVTLHLTDGDVTLQRGELHAVPGNSGIWAENASEERTELFVTTLRYVPDRTVLPRNKAAYDD